MLLIGRSFYTLSRPGPCRHQPKTKACRGGPQHSFSRTAIHTRLTLIHISLNNLITVLVVCVAVFCVIVHVYNYQVTHSVPVSKSAKYVHHSPIPVLTVDLIFVVLQCFLTTNIISIMLKCKYYAAVERNINSNRYLWNSVQLYFCCKQNVLEDKSGKDVHWLVALSRATAGPRIATVGAFPDVVVQAHDAT